MVFLQFFEFNIWVTNSTEIIEYIAFGVFSHLSPFKHTNDSVLQYQNVYLKFCSEFLFENKSFMAQQLLNCTAQFNWLINKYS